MGYICVFSLSSAHTSFANPDIERDLALYSAFFFAIVAGGIDCKADTYKRVFTTHTRLYECSYVVTCAYNRTICPNTRKTVEDLILNPSRYRRTFAGLCAH